MAAATRSSLHEPGAVPRTGVWALPHRNMPAVRLAELVDGLPPCQPLLDVLVEVRCPLLQQVHSVSLVAGGELLITLHGQLQGGDAARVDRGDLRRPGGERA